MRQTFSPPRAVLRNVLLAAMALAGCAVPAAKEANAPARPDFTEVVVTANKLASEAGLAMLKRGGAPIDAAVAAQAVLGLVEPQSSGPGGGSVLLLWQAEAGKLSVIDGTPRAGRNAAAGLNTGPSGEPVDPASAMYGGAAVGVPGTLPALWAAHRAHGKLPWAELFAPAIKLADDGFAMPQALYKTLTAPGAAQALRDLAALYGPVLPQPGPWCATRPTPPPCAASPKMGRRGCGKTANCRRHLGAACNARG